jgi:hypothetical protein
MTSPTRRTVTRRSTLPSTDVEARRSAGRSRFATWATGHARRLFVALSVLAGCSDPPGNDPNVPDPTPDGTILDLEGTAVCPPATPSSCPQTPSYSKDIAPLIVRTCLPCHAPGGVAADRSFSAGPGMASYANFLRLETTDFVQVAGCIMPPPDAGPDAALSLQDRTELLQWFVCGSPDN